VIPQAHAFDNATIAENVAGQAQTARTAADFAAGADLHVGPIMLRRRSSAAVESTGFGGALTDIPEDADPRQPGSFLAAWTLASIATLSQEEVAAVTYFELTGCRGVIGSHRQAQLPAPFGPVAAAVYPVYHVFADLAELDGGNWSALHVDTQDTAVGLLCRNKQSDIALVANLTDRSWTCRLPFTASRLRILDQTTEASAMQAAAEFRERWCEWSSAEFELPPHSYVRAAGAAP
jgi:hypothetical protein